MMFVGFLGCYGAIQESQCLLGTVRGAKLWMLLGTVMSLLGSTWPCLPCWRLFQQMGWKDAWARRWELADLCKEQGSAVWLRASLPSLLELQLSRQACCRLLLMPGCRTEAEASSIAEEVRAAGLLDIHSPCYM